MLINLTDVLTAANCVRDYDFKPSDLDIIKDGMYTTLDKSYAVKEMGPVHVRVSRGEDDKVNLFVESYIVLDMTCDRCLDDVSTRVDISYEDKLTFGRNGYIPEDVLDNCDYISGYKLDVDRLVYSEISLNIPMKVLCKETCKGICNRCGTNLNRASCECEHDEQLDPRMSAIRDIFQEF
jgi:uncharacterized protein